MDVTLALSLGIFYFSLAGLAAVVVYRIVKWAHAKRTLLADIRKKWEERKRFEQAKQVFGESVAKREHSLFAEAFGGGKPSMVMKPEPVPTTLSYEDTHFSEQISEQNEDSTSETTFSEHAPTETQESASLEDAEADWDEVQLTLETETVDDHESHRLTTDQEEPVHGDLTPQKIITLLRRVDALIARRDFDEAKKILIRILSWQEDHFDAGAHLAYVYLQSGEHRKAESLYRKALELRPRDASLLTNFALSVLEQKDPMRIDDSVKAFRLAAELDPKNPDRYANLGQSLFFAGDIPNAIAAFEKAVRLAPRNVEYYFFLADSYLTIRNFALAKKVFLKILDLAPLNQEAKQELGELQRMGY